MRNQALTSRQLIFKRLFFPHLKEMPLFSNILAHSPFPDHFHHHKYEQRASHKHKHQELTVKQKKTNNKRETKISLPNFAQVFVVSSFSLVDFIKIFTK